MAEYGVRNELQNKRMDVYEVAKQTGERVCEITYVRLAQLCAARNTPIQMTHTP